MCPLESSDGPATTLCILTSFFVVVVSLTSRIPSSKLGGRKMLSSLALPQKLVPPMKLEMLRTTMPSGTIHILCQQNDCLGGFKNKSSFCLQSVLYYCLHKKSLSTTSNMDRQLLRQKSHQKFSVLKTKKLVFPEESLFWHFNSHFVTSVYAFITKIF